MSENQNQSAGGGLLQTPPPPPTTLATASNGSNAAVATPTMAAIAASATCCEFFVDTLNSKAATRAFLLVNAAFSGCSTPAKQFVVNNELTFRDVESFLAYCQVWEQK